LFRFSISVSHANVNCVQAGAVAQATTAHTKSQQALSLRRVYEDSVSADKVADASECITTDVIMM
jgi:hypothetical protein